MSKFHPLPISRVDRETRDAVAVTFAVPQALRDQFRYAQGQHLTLRCAIDGQDVRRSYSICSAVQDDELRIAIKRAPGGAFSSWANERLKPGDTLDVMPPMGHFNVPLERDAQRHYVAFAAGSGITPILSIVKTTLAVEPRSIYALQGEARWGWQHSVAPVDTLRWSITFRTARQPGVQSIFSPPGRSSEA